MIDILKSIITQFFIALYQITSFKIWGLDLGEVLQKAHDYVINSTYILVLQIILLPITILLVIGLSVYFRKKRDLYEKSIAESLSATKEEPASALAARWQDILKRVESIREGEWKFAIIEADKVVDDLLKNLFPGETMGERLMNIDKTQLLSIDSLWEAHKIRNRLAHDTNYFLRHSEAVRAINLYEKTLQELGAL